MTESAATMQPVTTTPIGVVRSPHHEPAHTPKQSESARGIAGRVEIEPAFAAGLRDLEGFSYVWLVVFFHRAGPYALEVATARDEPPHGVFATRAPYRPNALGLSLVRLTAVEGNTLHIEDIDLLDGTPVLDIKPYVPLLDDRATERIGWFARKLR